MDFDLPQHILPGASAFCALTPVGYTNDRASSIWSFQQIQGRPLCRLLQISASNTRLAGASFSIRTTWLRQRSRWILIRCTTSMSLRNSYSSLLNRMWKLSPTRTVPKILRRTFLSRPLHQCLIMSIPLRHKEVRVG